MRYIATALQVVAVLGFTAWLVIYAQSLYGLFALLLLFVVGWE